MKKYFTGNGSAGKDDMVGATVRRSRDLDIGINNEVDVLGITSFLSRLADEPVDGKMPGSRPHHLRQGSKGRSPSCAPGEEPVSGARPWAISALGDKIIAQVKAARSPFGGVRLDTA